MRNTTAKFTFPNGGHSIRKLVFDLKEMGEQIVEPRFEYCNHYPEDESFEVWFETAKDVDKRYDLFIATNLAKKLVTMGTRFECEILHNRVDFKFHTKWSDISQHPEVYGVL